jgi:transposase
LTVLDQLNEQLKASRRQVDQLAQQQRWCQNEALLRSMPGVGRITALTVLAELGKLSRFNRRSAVANYAGLVPVQRQSNDKTFRGQVTKRGSNHLRRVLTEAAWQAIRRSVKYGQQYERLKATRGSQKAVTAVARKMLEDMYTLLKTNTVFRDSARATGC